MEKPAIGTLHIEGWKSFAKTDVSFGNINVLLGANGAGKSSLLYLFEFLSAVYTGTAPQFLEKYGGLDTVLYYGIKRTHSALIEVELFGTLYRVTLSPEGIGICAGKDCSESLAEQISKLTPLSVYRLRDTKLMTLPHPMSDSLHLNADGSNFAAILLRLKQEAPAYYMRIVQTIRLASPGFQDFVFEEKDGLLQTFWDEKNSGGYHFPLSILSGGTLRFAVLAVLLLQPAPPKLILIDEPELGLHPFAVNVLADLFYMAANRSQLVVSTQSVQLVNSFQPEHILIVDNRSGSANIYRPDAEELHSWLQEYTLGDLWQKNLMGGNP